MTLADLLTTLETRGVLPASRGKDLKTSLKYLASALGHTSPAQCPVDDACRDPAAWTAVLETHFATLETQGRTISGSTRRNTRNNLRVLWRTAEAHGLLEAPLPPVLLTKPERRGFLRHQRETAPYRTTYRPQTGPRYFGLPQAQWPLDIQAGWRTYQAKCGFGLRATTFHDYAKALATYLGYQANICGRTPAWDDVFDVAQLTAFVRWQGARVGRPLSAQGRNLVMMIAAMANVLEHPHAEALADLRRGLQLPAPLHTKRLHWVSLATLEAVADACLHEGRLPLVGGWGSKHPGSQRATKFQKGVILKLLVRIPLRQRNVREMRLERNLYQDQQTGHWHLHFSGAELKIGTRGGQVNEYHVDLTDYCPDFLPVLDEFLQVHRPKLPGATTSPRVFLTWHGTPFSESALRTELVTVVAMRTGQRFYPHLIRTIWATEYLEKHPGDYDGAADALGDTVAVVMQTYAHLDKRVLRAKQKAFLATALHRG